MPRITNPTAASDRPETRGRRRYLQPWTSGSEPWSVAGGGGGALGGGSDDNEFLIASRLLLLGRSQTKSRLLDRSRTLEN